MAIRANVLLAFEPAVCMLCMLPIQPSQAASRPLPRSLPPAAPVLPHQLPCADVKGENVMLEAGTGTLRIIDFGLSKRQQSAVTLGVGTIDVSGVDW